MEERMILSYTLKDIENIGKIIKEKAEKKNMSYRECISNILDFEVPEGPDVVPVEIEDIYDIIYHNLYVFNEDLEDKVKEETSFLRYRLEDSIRLTAFSTAIQLLLRMSVVEDDLNTCIPALSEVDKTTEVKTRDPKWLLILKYILFKDKARARFRWNLKEDTPLFKTFIFFVFENDLGTIIENSLILDRNRRL